MKVAAKTKTSAKEKPMIISDLNHLEVVSEASSVVGGGKYYCKPKHGKPTPKPTPKAIILVPFQSNFSVVNQEANAESTAVSLGKGDANSQAIAKNEATVVQING